MKPDLISVLCAVEQGVLIDPKHQALIDEAIADGLVEEIKVLQLTETGKTKLYERFNRLNKK